MTRIINLTMSVHVHASPPIQKGKKQKKTLWMKNRCAIHFSTDAFHMKCINIIHYNALKSELIFLTELFFCNSMAFFFRHQMKPMNGK